MPESLDGRGNLILKDLGEPIFVSKSKMKIIPPKSLFWGLLIAISGHSFWNGSGLIISYFGYEFGLSEGQVFMTSVLWVLILVIMVLLVSSLLMRGINSLSE